MRDFETKEFGAQIIIINAILGLSVSKKHNAAANWEYGFRNYAMVFFMDCVPNTSKTEAQTKLALMSLLILL